MSQQPIQRGRRQFFRVVAAAVAMIPVVAANQARAGHWGPPFDRPRPWPRHRCLLPGTAILTDRGPVVVERLQIGNLVLMESGVFKPIKGIGRNALTKGSSSRWDESVGPVRITQSAISANVPARDLYLSPEHALFIDGYLIPVKYLINGLTITQDVSAFDVVEYNHIEFEQHEVFYAEGTAVESLRTIDVRQTAGRFAQYERDERGGSVTGAMQPYAPQLGYCGGRQEAVALARLAIHPWIDVRDHIQVVFDRLVARAKLLPAGAAETALAG